MLDNYQCAPGPTGQIEARGFGNALLARHPIVDVHRLDLSLDGREPRGALAATVEVRGTRVHSSATRVTTGPTTANADGRSASGDARR